MNFDLSGNYCVKSYINLVKVFGIRVQFWVFVIFATTGTYASPNYCLSNLRLAITVNRNL